MPEFKHTISELDAVCRSLRSYQYAPEIIRVKFLAYANGTCLETEQLPGEFLTYFHGWLDADTARR
jgi:hypothetical protein